MFVSDASKIFLLPETNPNVPRADLKIPRVASDVNASYGAFFVPSPNLRLPVDRSVPPELIWKRLAPISLIFNLCCSQVSLLATLIAGILD